TESPSTLGVLLWASARDVRLWSEVEPGERGGMFADGAASLRLQHIFTTPCDAEIASHLGAIAALLISPETVTASDLVSSCSHVARWAAGRKLPKAALAFSQAAAFVDRNDAALCLLAGLAAVQAKELVRADSWLRRAVGQARRTDRQVYALALAALAKLLFDHGQRVEAQRHAAKAIRAGRRYGCSEARAQGFHVLFRLAAGLRQYEDADRHALAAMNVYGANHSVYPLLVLELGRSYVRRGDPARAVALLTPDRMSLFDRAQAVEALALLSLASARIGERAQFQDAWSRAWALIRRIPEGAVPPGVREDLTAAAECLGDTDRAHRSATLRDERSRT
ncbi:MAG TPA: hypothetical protein VFE05_17790, partial [Longimicrobiaceae bacterium]|nr:hypothetical protein [Longimicrobiaceae bacterium]